MTDSEPVGGGATGPGQPPRTPAGLGDAAPPGAGEVTATVIVNAPAATVFKAFTAWERQGEWIPFTQVRITEGDGGPGSSIEAVTQVGPAIVRDEMRVVWPGSKLGLTQALRRFARLVESGRLP